MKTLRLYETTYRGDVAYKAQSDKFGTPIYLVWMENLRGRYALYNSTYTILEKFGEVDTIEDAKKKMQDDLLRWAQQYSRNEGLPFEGRIVKES